MWLVIVILFAAVVGAGIAIWYNGEDIKARTGGAVFVPPSQTKASDVPALRGKWLFFSQHGVERMLERGISQADVRYVMKNGYVNDSKSVPPQKYAVEAVTNGKLVRVIVAPHLWVALNVVTVINLWA